MWIATIVTAMAVAAPAAPPRSRVMLVELGDFPAELVPVVARALEAELDVEVRLGPRLPVPPGALAFDETYSAEALLGFLEEQPVRALPLAHRPARAALIARPRRLC